MTDYITLESTFIGTEQDDEDDPANWEHETLPAKYAVCDTCQGKGGSSNYLGAFTSDRWNEQDDDFKEDYMSGKYDRKCEECNGLRVVLVPDKDHPDFDQKLFEKWLQYEDDKYTQDRISRQERAFEMGSFYGVEEGWYD